MVFTKLLFTDAVSIKEEKEDDYEYQLPVKQEKNSQPIDDELEISEENLKTIDQPETEVINQDDDETKIDSPKNGEDERITES